MYISFSATVLGSAVLYEQYGVNLAHLPIYPYVTRLHPASQRRQADTRSLRSRCTVRLSLGDVTSLPPHFLEKQALMKIAERSIKDISPSGLCPPSPQKQALHCRIHRSSPPPKFFRFPTRFHRNYPHPPTELAHPNRKSWIRPCINSRSMSGWYVLC